MGHTLFRIFSISVLCMMILIILLSSPGVAATGSVTDYHQPLQTTPGGNNSTVQHENPTEVSQTGDSQQVSQWLQNRLQTQLQGSAVNISEGEYESARNILGDEYTSRFEQFVDVAGDTDTESDDQAIETFNETRSAQRDFANASESYQETYEEYQRARSEGNTSAPRELARQLENISTRVERLNQTLQQNYQSIENQTGVETDEIQASITNETIEITSQQTAVQDQTFVGTYITVTTNGTAVAFDSPLNVTGQLTMANGTVISNRTVRLRVSQRVYRPTTDSTGRFTIAYRPTELALNATDVRVAYAPTGTAPFLGSSTRVPVNVSQVSPSANLTVTPQSGSYGDRVTATVQLSVDNRTVPGIGVTASLGPDLTTGTTDETGQVTLRPEVQGGLSVGERMVEVSQTQADVAIGPFNATTPINVTSTLTELNISAEINTGRLLIDGQLLTDAGRPVAGQSIAVAFGETTRSVVTNETGWYDLQLNNISETSQNSTVVSVSARFDGARTNLESSQASTTVETGQLQSAGQEGASPFRTLGLIGIVAVVLVSGFVLLSRADSPEGDSTAETSKEQSDSVTTMNTDRYEVLSEQARTALANEEFETAIVAAYGAIRTLVGSRTDEPDSLTHQEFLTSANGTVDHSLWNTVSIVADAYEQVTFAGDIDKESVEKAVQALEETTADSN